MARRRTVYGIPLLSLDNVNPQVNGWNNGDDSNGVSEKSERLRRSKRLRENSDKKMRQNKRPK